MLFNSWKQGAGGSRLHGISLFSTDHQQVLCGPLAMHRARPFGSHRLLAHFLDCLRGAILSLPEVVKSGVLFDYSAALCPSKLQC